MQEMDLPALFLLGLFGTGHCLGMCGPLVLALPTSPSPWRYHLLYHLGRVGTYTLMGALLGGLGSALGRKGLLPQMESFQIAIAGLTGFFLIGFGLVRLGLVPEPGWMARVAVHKLPGFRWLAQAAVTRERRWAILAFGFWLGLLPCGLSYPVFAWALSSGNTIWGALGLAAFGLGTVPGLLLIGTGFAGVWRRYQRAGNILAGLLMLYMGAKLLIRFFA